MSSSNRSAVPMDIPRGSPTRGRTGYSDCALDDNKDLSRSFSSDTTFSTSPSQKSRSWVKSGQTVNVYTTCGRQTDHLLFGGHPSLTEFARSIMKKR